jgi:hypothetical protein
MSLFDQYTDDGNSSSRQNDKPIWALGLDNKDQEK